MKYQLITGLLALAFVAAASLAGDHRRAAMTGAVVAGGTAFAEILLMGFATGRARNALQGAWIVFASAFLVRLLLLALATVLVRRAGWNVIAFVAAFFVPFFALSAIEWGYLHSLRRLPGTHA